MKRKKKYTLCPTCKKKIHIKDFGGVAKTKDGKVGIYHLWCIDKAVTK